MPVPVAVVAGKVIAGLHHAARDRAGDGLFYPFEDDPNLVFAAIHENGRDLYPGTGAPEETGMGPEVGTKLNLPLRPGTGDTEFLPLGNGFRRIWSDFRASPSCSSVAPTALPAIRSPTCGSEQLHTRAPRSGYV
jgi:hypothetical protein